MTLTSTFDTIVITDIPVLKISDKNQARRFISLIDALYEARCRLICLASAPPDRLFFPDAAENISHSIEDFAQSYKPPLTIHVHIIYTSYIFKSKTTSISVSCILILICHVDLNKVVVQFPRR